MSLLILVRHGESLWNQANLFTGWVDVPLSEKGVQEAIQAGGKLSPYPIDLVFTSTLVRSLMTAMLLLLHHRSGKTPIVQHIGEGKMEEWGRHHGDPSHCIPVIRAWELNERMYGDLQGLDKNQTRARFGEEQVQIWRRSYAVTPPGGESLAMTAQRACAYFNAKIRPRVEKGTNVLISAHGNSLRALIMELDGLSEEEVVQLELPTGEPVVYQCKDSFFERMKAGEERMKSEG